MPIAPRVNPAPLPGVRVSSAAPDAAFGGGAGNAIAGIEPGLSAVHDEAFAIARQEKAKADQIMLTAATADLSSARTDTLYGPNGALTKQGKDAFTAPEDARANYFARATQIRDGLTSDEQREAFDRATAADWSTVDEQVQRHVATQRDAYDASTTDALVANKQSEALNGYTDPTIVQASIDSQRDAITAYGQRHGWSDEQTQGAVANLASKTHVDVISRMLDNDQDQLASSYYAAHKDDILGTEQAKLEKAIKVGSTQGDALRRVTSILAPDRDGTPPSASDALAQAEDIDDPKVREEALRLVTAHFTEQNSAQRIDRENARARVIQSIEQHNGRLNQASSDWQLIDGYAEGEQVLERQRQILHPPRDPGDPDKLANFLAMAATNADTRDQLLSTDIGSIANDPTMNGTQKAAVITLIRTERNKDAADLQKSHADAEASVKQAQRDLKAANDGGDDDAVASATSRLYDAQQREAVLRGQLTIARRTARTGAAAPARGSGKEAGATPSAPTDARTPANPVGLTPDVPITAKALTPEMQQDLTAYGAGYANYLRTMGYDVPTTPMPAARGQRAPAAAPSRATAPRTPARSSAGPAPVVTPNPRPAGGYPNPFRP